MIPRDKCVFCRIYDGRAEANILLKTHWAMIIEPISPVVPGHVLVIPRDHVQDWTESPVTSEMVMYEASKYARDHLVNPSNLITSAGSEATQTVFHLHLHIVPRSAGDNLKLPWDKAPDEVYRVAAFLRSCVLSGESLDEGMSQWVDDVLRPEGSRANP